MATLDSDMASTNYDAYVDNFDEIAMRTKHGASGDLQMLPLN